MAIYNEYRPLKLSEVRGQQAIKTQIEAMFSSGSVPNALLFTGPRGTGKTTMARIVARYVNCEDPHGDPCNECQSCKDILAGHSPDVMELDAASNNKVDDVRSLIEAAQYTPVGKRKVFILDEVHMLSIGAWNALLKILEEPPKSVVFILCTTEEQKIPATIISRCRRFLFERVDLAEIVSLMEDICEEKEKAYDKDALLMIARASEGCVRDALSILESFLDVDAVVAENVATTLGLSGEDVVFNILEGVEKGDAVMAVGALKQAEGRGVNLSALVKSLIGAISDALFIKQGADIRTVLNTVQYKERLETFAPCITTGRCVELIGELSAIYGSMSKTPDASFLLEASLIKAIQVQSELGALKERVAQLEKAVAEGATTSVISVPEEKAEAAPVAETEQTEPDFSDVPASVDEGLMDGFEDADDVPPFDEDPEPDSFDDMAMAASQTGQEAAVPAEEQRVEETMSTEVQTSGEVEDKEDEKEPDEIPTMADIYEGLDGLEFGEPESLFTSEDDDAPAPAVDAEESEEKPEESPHPFKKEGAEAPTVNVEGLSGFVWQ